MTKPLIQHTVQLRRVLLTASAVTLALLIALVALTVSDRHTPPSTPVHNGQAAPMATSSPDNCSSCHS